MQAPPAAVSPPSLLNAETTAGERHALLPIPTQAATRVCALAATRSSAGRCLQSHAARRPCLQLAHSTRTARRHAHRKPLPSRNCLRVHAAVGCQLHASQTGAHARPPLCRTQRLRTHLAVRWQAHITSSGSTTRCTWRSEWRRPASPLQRGGRRLPCRTRRSPASWRSGASRRRRQ